MAEGSRLERSVKAERAEMGPDPRRAKLSVGNGDIVTKVPIADRIGRTDTAGRGCKVLKQTRRALRDPV